MKGDFSRIGFDAKNHFSQVLLQQGRVALDADPNEQGAILLHYLRTLARDIIGPCGGPTDALGFGLALDSSVNPPALTIGAGRYYIDGILVENEAACGYATQPDFSPAAEDPLLARLKASGGDDVWLYLDVWERHVSWIEVDAIRESALGGPDTCSRSQVVWQVKSLARGGVLQRLQTKRDGLQKQLAAANPPLPPQAKAALQKRLDQLVASLALLGPNATGARGPNDCNAPLDSLDEPSDALMAARLDPGQRVKDPCVIAPDALYRGAENQLYRVEVHRGSAAGAPSFKWSRDNGSVATRWLGTQGNELMALSGRGFTAGCWVELSDDRADRAGLPGLLVRLAKVQGDRLGVDPASIPPGQSIAWRADLANPKLRRWDQSETDDTTLDQGAVPVTETGAGNDLWLDLEDGIQVQFQAGGSYRSGDYWLIPARVATGGIEWPTAPAAGGGETSLAEPPRGVAHHYASLGYIGLVNGQLAPTACLCTIAPINSCSIAARRDALAPAPEAPQAPTPSPAPPPTKPVKPAAPPAKPK